MSARRPMPEGFRDAARTYAKHRLLGMFGVGSTTLARWLTELESPYETPPPILQRPMPEDFAEHAHETNHQLMDRYGCGTKVLVRWRKMVGVTPRDPREASPAPQGFKMVASTLTMRELRERFHRSEPVIRRWCRIEGVEPKRVWGKEAARLVAGRATRHFSPQTPIARDMSRVGQAVDFLRRFGPVVRCNIGGRYDPHGDRWRRGSTILTGAEIIDRAERLGWDGDAWKRVAA